MKQINLSFILTILMCIVGIFTISTFISCGGDDEGPFSEYNNNGNGNGNGNNNSGSGSDNTGSNKGLSISGYHNSRAYVDLGLSVKWATMNIGAKSVTDIGLYFAWGEISIKNQYDVDHSKWISWSTSSSPINIKKYCTDSSLGSVDGITILEVADDAASRYWQGNWRMPTKDEMKELIDNCIWTKCSSGNSEYSGATGFKVVSKINGNYLFLPATGYRDSGDTRELGKEGHYWTASLSTSSSYAAYSLECFDNISHIENGVRWEGLQVRAVCP